MLAINAKERKVQAELSRAGLSLEKSSPVVAQSHGADPMDRELPSKVIERGDSRPQGVGWAVQLAQKTA